MATKQELRAAFARQGNALPNCCSGATGEIRDKCFGISGRRMIIAGRVGDWNALPNESPDFDPRIDALDASSDMLEDGNSCSAALDKANQALDELEALLDSV